MASKIKVDTLETADGTGSIALSNQLSGMTVASLPPEATAAASLTGALPAISGANLTNLPAGDDNTPAFQAYMSTNMTGLSSGTNYKIQFNTVDFDTNSAWDTTNYKFTVPSGEGGKYFVSGNIYMAGSDGAINRYAHIYIYKNGSNLGMNYTHVGQHSTSNSISRIMTLSAGDYIEFYFQQYGWSSGTIYTSSNITRTVASAFKLAGV